MELVVLCQCLFWCVFVMVSERWSVDHLKPVCVHCGCEGTGRTLNISQTSYPKCNQCGSKDDVIRRKRKIVTAEDLVNKRKK